MKTYPEFNIALRDVKQGDSKDQHFAKCPKNTYLGGFRVVPRFAKDLWLEDIVNGVCIKPNNQIDKFGKIFENQNCYTQPVKWRPNSWVYCEELGYYLAGIEKFGGRGPGLDNISGLHCCMPKITSFKDLA